MPSHGSITSLSLFSQRHFAGNVTAGWREQNPDLFSGENSASALLERIKTEQVNLEHRKKIHKENVASRERRKH